MVQILQPKSPPPYKQPLSPKVTTLNQIKTEAGRLSLGAILSRHRIDSQNGSRYAWDGLLPSESVQHIADPQAHHD